MLERFTRAARSTVERAVADARGLGSSAVEPAHLLFSLAADDVGPAGPLLRSLGADPELLRAGLRRRSPGALTAEEAEALWSIGIDLEAVVQRVEDAFGRDALTYATPSRRRPRFARGAKKSLELALREAVHLKSREIGTEHLLLGLLRVDDDAVVALLHDAGTTAAEVRLAVVDQLGRAA